VSIHDTVVCLRDTDLVLQSLSNWSVTDECCLSNLLDELLAEYKLHHRQMVAAQRRLSFELNTLLESSEYCDVDVYCSSSSDVSATSKPEPRVLFSGTKPDIHLPFRCILLSFWQLLVR